ncbi:Subtilase family protein [Variovorax sp. HW608]|uniref:hypothetical protein n=1 Tax=Variovorax sp. HW608 TaxID=1034889 RepID=UPI00081FBF83|nr:hypothetical protein [Variovorax sp. HW608]SCK35098.1 Subtilase family protein [Variovorax sp. HW608]
MQKPLELPLSLVFNADAYLQWAMLTKFKYFNLKPSDTYAVLVEFSGPLERSAIEKMRIPELIWITSYEGHLYAAINLSKEGFEEHFVDQLQLLQQSGLLCLELAAPTGMLVPEFPKGVAPGSDTVIGVIDDGCPFAHVHLRGEAPNEPAVRFIWDQGSGVFFTEPDLQALMAGATSAIGSIDEDSAYLASGLPSLRSATSHGAQVLSHASGHAHDTKPLPPHIPNPIDIAFVQFPGDALDHPNGEWLHHLALRGIQAIRAYARDMCKKKASRILINLSYGPRTGPHDGTSILEKAIDAITAQAVKDGYDLRVVVPSGNSHLSRAHAQFDLARGGGVIDWHVAPDTQTPCYLEIWLPLNTPIGDLEIFLKAPNGEEIPAQYPGIHHSANETAWTVAVHVCGDTAKKMVLMIVTPTARSTGTDWLGGLPLATAGRWKVAVKVRPGCVVPGIADAYLARNEPNLGRIRRGYDGYFDSPNYDPKRYLKESSQLDVKPSSIGPAEVVAAGSINGIATGAKSDVIAAYYASAPGMPSSYSSGDPSRGARKQPDWAYPGDDSKVLSGRLAGGNRSATVMRLVGTSFTAPQFVYESIVLPLPPVTPSNPPRTERLGDGCR